jgi:hypothetical protein
MRKIRAALTLTAILAGTAVRAAPAPDNVPARGMVWAHYVPWNRPSDASVRPCFYYDHPCYDGGEAAWREEIDRAMAAGIDGFFVDIGIYDTVPNPLGESFRWLEAARGTDFKVGVCLDRCPPPRRMAEELARLLAKHGDHPNYPRIDGRYVVANYAPWRYKPEQWREILDFCAATGRPVFLVGDIKHGTGPATRAVMEKWENVFDAMYMFAYIGQESITARDENMGVATFCRERGKTFMASLEPGYIGSWLGSGLGSYKPFRGVDKLVEEFLAIRAAGGDWMHFTTWNDHLETAMEPTRLQPANPRILRAFSDEFKGREPSAAEAEVVLAYRREEVPGTLMRFEAMLLPSRERGAATVSGRLRDATGKIVANLEPKVLSNGFDRVEWLVRSADLAASPYLTPEFAMDGPDGRRREARFQPVFFALPWIGNNATVKASFADRCAEIDGTLGVSYEGGCIRASLELRGDRPVRRAILYRNDRPIGQFAKGGGKPSLSVAVFDLPRDCVIGFSGCAVATRLFPHSNRELFRLEFDSPSAPASMSAYGTNAAFTAATLAKRRRLKAGQIEARVVPACTVRDDPPLDAAAGRFELSLIDRRPDSGDAFWVRFEMPDGTACETPVAYPFGDLRELRRITLLETDVNLDSKNGHQGGFMEREYLTPANEMPMTGTVPRDCDVSPLIFRKGRWSLEDSLDDDFSFRAAMVKTAADGKKTTVMPLHMWPMAPGAVAFDIFAAEGVETGKCAVIRLETFNEGFSANLLADGRLEAVWSGGCKGPVWKQEVERIEALESVRAVRDGQWHRVVLENDARKIRIRIDGKVDAERDADPFRAYGRCTVSLPDNPGVNVRNLEIGLP